MASAPTICRVVDDLVADLDAAVGAIRSARAEARASVRRHAAGDRDEDAEVVVDIDATLVTAHSEKESAALVASRPPR